MARRNLPQILHPARRVTLADVASEAGCSTALVSSVINRSNTNAGASPALTLKIQEAAKRLGYRPDFASQSLARRSTRTIGVYVPPAEGSSLAYPYESAILRGIELACQQRGHDLLVINLGGNATPDTCTHRFTERRIDGLVLLHVADDAAWIGPLLDRHARTVSVNYYGDERRLPRVNFDDRAATAMSVEHLVHLGHERIAYVGLMNERPGPGAVLRREGFEQAMVQCGLAIPDAWIIDRTFDRTAWPGQPLEHGPTGDFAVDRLMSLPGPRPTALVCYGDLGAIAAIRRLQHHGLSVPRDISVIGLDDMELCRYVDPPLTTIRQPLEDMGERAAQLLFEHQPEGDAVEVARQELVRPSLVVRQSTAAPRRGMR
jgi:DNA-binding LacI/PurR family transcriptional regulator